MDLSGIIEHMNSSHKDSVFDLVQKYAGVVADDAKMVAVDSKGMNIEYNGTHNLRIDFDVECSGRDAVVSTIIALCKDAKPGDKTDKQSIEQEIEAFRNEFGSVVIASVGKDGNAVSSYAPLIRYNGGLYIYISQIADHYSSISNNPDNIQILFVEDESKSKTLLARRRITYRVKAHFIKRNTPEFESALDLLENDNRMSGAKTVRNMGDFHLIRLEILSGRFVKGFGQAYDIDSQGHVSHIGGGMPHQMGHKQ